MKDYTFKNRELSWLDFNARVLQEAEDPNVPLIERIRFIGIFSNNLDEFYKVRYATVKRIALSGKKQKKLYQGLNAIDLLKEITKKTIELQNRSTDALNSIINKLKSENIHFVDEKTIPKKFISLINDFFIDKIQPQLEIVVLNKKSKFPNLTDTSSFLTVKIISKKQEQKYALIKIPTKLDRFLVLSETNQKYVILIDDIIRFHLNEIFEIFSPQSIKANMIKISRDAELDFAYDISKSYLEKISLSLKNRSSGEPVRFVYDNEIEKETLDFLLDKLKFDHDTDSIIPGGKYHNRRDYMSFPSMNKNNLSYKKFKPLDLKGFDLSKNIFDTLKKRDYLLHTPFHKFTYILRLLSEASIDPSVTKISITIYRLSKLSSVANALINAAKNGKEVVVQIELQARFDEKANIKYAKLLEEQGVKLIFGIQNLKVHAKICVIERKSSDGLEKFGFISTGNFNESTAKIYTDFTLFTCDKKILNDISKVFKFFNANYKKFNFQHLKLSPFDTQSFFTKMLKREIKNAKKGLPAYVKIKLNSLTSYAMVEELYKASREGVKIKMIVRGICCLLPENEKNIEIRSVVDRFLEHTRFFIFNNNGKNETYISSADWMTRNLDNRVEVTCPIFDPNIKKEINDIFEIYWSDNVKSRTVNNEIPNQYQINQNSKKLIRSQIEINNYYKSKLEK
jgi:polyphosphate kinase